MAYWEAQQEAEYASEKSSLERDISSAESTEKKKSIYSVGGGMVGAIGAPLLAAALAPMTGGASMAIPTLMGLVGAGSVVGRTVGSALGGKSKKIGGGTFLKDERSRSRSLIDEAGTQRRKDIIWGSIKDAGTAGFLKSGGLDAFKEIGAKGLTKFFGKDTAESLYKASGMMATGGEEFSTLLEGTKTRDMWNQLGQLNPLNYKTTKNINPMESSVFSSPSLSDIKGEWDLKAAKESLSSEKMKARTHDPSMFGMSNFEKQTYTDSLKRAGQLGEKNLKLAEKIEAANKRKKEIKDFGKQTYEKSLERSDELGKMNLERVESNKKIAEGLKGLVGRDVNAGRTLYGQDYPYDEAALHKSQAKHLFHAPLKRTIEGGEFVPSEEYKKSLMKPSAIEDAQSMLNQKVSMYNDVWDDYSQET